MDGKSSDWRPTPTVCRCCLAEGCYKDISTEYFWMGKREVYSEMLSQTLDVTIAYSQSGGPNSNSRLICEPCISRLRDATEFKRQVLECEKTFMQHLDPGRSTVTDNEAVTIDLEEKDVKLEQVKQEKQNSDDDFDNPEMVDDDDDDDLDDQPLTKLASKVPKKESVDFLDLLDNTKAAEKRKSTIKLKTPPVKRAKTKPVEAKPTASKTKAPEKKKKDDIPLNIAKRNAKIILQYSTAYPFRLPEQSMVCVFCCEDFLEPTQFRKHMEYEHQDFKVHLAFSHLCEGYLKADCTNLSCRVCSERFGRLEDVAEHLYSVHNKPLDLSADLGLQPFILHQNKFLCAICGQKFFLLRALSRHTQKHFVKFTCESCGKSYSTSTSLQAHIKYTHLHNSKDGNHMCRKCKKLFTSLEAKKAHMQLSKKCCQHLCNVCGERFMTWNLKQTHMADSHGKPKKTYNCLECGESFDKRDHCLAHFKIEHTTDHLTCSYCGQKYHNKRGLEEHIVIHTKEKRFPCTFCSKSFSRKKNLIQHMWVHSEHKRFECTLCNKKFNQRVSWKTHMKSYHPGFVDF